MKEEFANHDREIKIQEMKNALKETERIANGYKEGEDDDDQEDRPDIIDVVCDNNVLIERAN